MPKRALIFLGAERDVRMGRRGRVREGTLGRVAGRREVMAVLSLSRKVWTRTARWRSGGRPSRMPVPEQTRRPQGHRSSATQPRSHTQAKRNPSRVRNSSAGGSNICLRSFHSSYFRRKVRPDFFPI
jgi:hypothetical protein